MNFSDVGVISSDLQQKDIFKAQNPFTFFFFFGIFFLLSGQ